MANIQIGKYKRPGIFIEEFDQSIITSPTVEGITNLVLGVSKKGPVNTPVRLTNINDLEAIFGQLDRNLERKGSFFHRTISKMLETAPVFAINLLVTDDTLDTIEYKSLSTSSMFDNDVIRLGAYRRFFDTTGFWKRDTQSFLNLTNRDENASQRAFNITNLSDRPITVFIFKSTLTGFDRTILEWYGAAEKMPTFVNQQDFASDYMVDVLIVGGNWSNYQELSVDPRWSAYFDSSGLKKQQVRNFANDRNITLLAFYEGLSLIPYFRDLNGRNIFIETVINRDTDRTGLYCAFNADLVEEDFYNGKLDLIGNTIVGKNETNIDFLSYKELIADEIQFSPVPLDLPGNVTILGDVVDLDHVYGTPMTSGSIDNYNRTTWFAEGYVNNVLSNSATFSSSTASVSYTVDSNAYAVIGGNKVDIAVSTQTFSVYNTNFPISTSPNTYYAPIVLDSNGLINIKTTPIANTYPTVATNELVLGYMTIEIDQNRDITEAVLNHVSVNNSGFNPLVHTSDYTIEETTNGIKVNFNDTNIPQNNTPSYEQSRRIRVFNRLVSLIDSPSKDRMVINLGQSLDYRKMSFENINITNIVSSQTSDKSFELIGIPTSDRTDLLDGFFAVYTVDNEFLIGEDGLSSSLAMGTDSRGAIGKYSTFYSRFFNGIINTRDFFYTNRLLVGSDGISNDITTVDIEFMKNNSKNYILFNATNFDTQVDFIYAQKLIFPTSLSNRGTYTIIGTDNPSTLATTLGNSGWFAYEVSELVVDESLEDVSVVFDADNRIFLKMFIDNNGVLTTDFMLPDFSNVTSINVDANNSIWIQSRKSNLKQTLEIESPVGYTQTPNKVLVRADRYTEVKVGDFLEAYYDEDLLQVGAYPRRLTRILSKRLYAPNPELTELTCDTSIKMYNFGSGDLQTMRYVSIDNYALTYKAIALKGFKIRQNSLPDGTEARQNAILNIVAKGTPMFKALTNKETIDFRYLIDSFGLGLIERSKQQLVDICGERLDVFGFINMPSMKDFINSASPTFTDSEGNLSVELIAAGGDLETNPAFLYSFGEGVGTSCVGYFTPYLTVNDNGRPIDLPPSSFVASTYMRKHTSSITAITPWTIAAGVNNGRITNILGTEIDFTNQDIEFLNLAQINPIVFKRNRGYIIETENTAQTLYRSSLSFIHVREVLIELERELSRMLLDYQWRFNTPDIRAEIKLRADFICETYVNRNGLYNYFNKMDDENNTPEIIDNQIGVLDTYIEPIKGMGIIVNNITILRTGAISAGGFINS
jgi:hypothetical protein